jgi:hypothetical protein
MKCIWLASLILALTSPFAHAEIFQPGFYLDLNQKVIAAYSDLVVGTHGKQSSLYTVDETGKITRLTSKQTRSFHGDYTFLGTTQKEAAQNLGKDTSRLTDTVYLAHRGISQIPVLKSKSVYPGNSMAAMKLALQNGYGGFEFDVQFTKDHQLVVSHDEDLSVSTSCTGEMPDPVHAADPRRKDPAQPGRNGAANRQPQPGVSNLSHRLASP